MNGSQPRAQDVNSLVTLTVTTYLYDRSEDTIMEKLDLDVPQSGIIPFTLSLSSHNSSYTSLQVRRE